LIHDQAGFEAPADRRRAPRPASFPPVLPAPNLIRLTRRGRIVMRAGGAVLLLLTVLLMVIAGVLLLDRTAQAGSQSNPVPVSYRVVLPGETLWQIAGEVAPGTDRRDTVAKIIELNALPGAALAAGQRIAVPASAP
jgi:hypothetical protein